MSDPTDLETLEIAEACGDLAAILNKEHGIASRSAVAVSDMAGTGAVPSVSTLCKVALFVALEEELDVLVTHLGLERRPGVPAAVGRLREAEIEVVCPRTMGRVSAAVETMRYLLPLRTKPDLIICVRLAGGFDSEPGQIICVDTVVDLALRKVTDDKDGKASSRFRREDFQCSRAVYEVSQSHADFDLDAWANESRKMFHWPLGKIPSLGEGKIASVDEVVASGDHQRKLLDSTDKLKVVEMEAGGFCAAARACKVPFAVIKVVSDKADRPKRTTIGAESA